MTFDNELVLITTRFTENKLGDSVGVRERRAVLCGVESITRSEHYQAAAHGITPEVVFLVNKHEYAGERECEFNGIPYRVIRSYEARRAQDIGRFESIELICEGATFDGST